MHLSYLHPLYSMGATILLCNHLFRDCNQHNEKGKRTLVAFIQNGKLTFTENNAFARQTHADSTTGFSGQGRENKQPHTTCRNTESIQDTDRRHSKTINFPAASGEVFAASLNGSFGTEA